MLVKYSIIIGIILFVDPVALVIRESSCAPLILFNRYRLQFPVFRYRAEIRETCQRYGGHWLERRCSLAPVFKIEIECCLFGSRIPASRCRMSICDRKGTRLTTWENGPPYKEIHQRRQYRRSSSSSNSRSRSSSVSGISSSSSSSSKRLWPRSSRL
ncbi:uncharacterized protein LOC118765258 [Octopus sinensis]|uniref:Uncharacterized protein LOC118765258 n=1 Tax=Octopus sinensis TaxID=2607531 RepID=A0A7E6F589_9MOLL|nr:uncharacterized protein LOC118765258 [Octopus sinensis]